MGCVSGSCDLVAMSNTLHRRRDVAWVCRVSGARICVAFGAQQARPAVRSETRGGMSLVAGAECAPYTNRAPCSPEQCRCLVRCNTGLHMHIGLQQHQRCCSMSSAHLGSVSMPVPEALMMVYSGIGPRGSLSLAPAPPGRPSS